MYVNERAPFTLSEQVGCVMITGLLLGIVVTAFTTQGTGFSIIGWFGLAALVLASINYQRSSRPPEVMSRIGTRILPAAAVISGCLAFGVYDSATAIGVIDIIVLVSFVAFLVAILGRTTLRIWRLAQRTRRAVGRHARV
jgi:hypothetical protein